MTEPRTSWYWLGFLSTGQTDAQWVSDIGGQTDMSYPLPLGTDVPRQCYLRHVWVGYGLGAEPTGPTELYVLLDPGGAFYKTGKPPGAEAGGKKLQCSALAYHCENNGIQHMRHYQIEPAVFFNRDAKDKLWFGLDGADPIGWGWLNLSWTLTY
jgi:hypothetical protein